MCLALPMKVISIDGLSAVCEAGGVSRTVNMYMLSDSNVSVGDHVLVHVGYAIP